MSPTRNLTEGDIQAIALALKESTCINHVEMFTPEEIAALKGLASLVKETRSVIIKTVVGAMVAFLITLMAIGFKGYFDVK